MAARPSVSQFVGLCGRAAVSLTVCWALWPRGRQSDSLLGFVTARPSV